MNNLKCVRFKKIKFTVKSSIDIFIILRLFSNFCCSKKILSSRNISNLAQYLLILQEFTCYNFFPNKSSKLQTILKLFLQSILPIWQITPQPQADWIDFNFNQVFNSLQKQFKILKNNNYHVGNHLLTTRLAVLNHKITVEDLNMSLDSFEDKYKKQMLQSNLPLLA